MIDANEDQRQASSPLPRIRPPGPLGARGRYGLGREIVLEKVAETLLPAMVRAGVDMWLVADREPVTDPISPMVGGAVGDGNVYAFWRSGDELNRAALISHGVRQGLLSDVFGDSIVRFGYEPAGFAPHLQAIVEAANPARIAVNMSADIGLADGLTVGMLDRIRAALGSSADRLVSATEVARAFVTKRTELETETYRELARWSTELARTALSAEFVRVGESTPADIHWAALEMIQAAGLASTWAVPGIRVTRRGDHRPVNDDTSPVMAGDILNLDLGLAYLGMQTDIKRNAVVVGPAGDGISASLAGAFDRALEARDVLAAALRPGRIGHEVWDEVMEWGRAKGYGIGAPVAGGNVPTSRRPELAVYCHSVGAAVHDAGARVGPREPGWGARVNYELETECWYALEFHVSIPVPDWDGKTVKVAIEEPIVLRSTGPEYLVEPQASWWTVGE